MRNWSNQLRGTGARGSIFEAAGEGVRRWLRRRLMPRGSPGAKEHNLRAAIRLRIESRRLPVAISSGREVKRGEWFWEYFFLGYGDFRLEICSSPDLGHHLKVWPRDQRRSMPMMAP